MTTHSTSLGIMVGLLTSVVVNQTSMMNLLGWRQHSDYISCAVISNNSWSQWCSSALKHKSAVQMVLPLMNWFCWMIVATCPQCMLNIVFVSTPQCTDKVAIWARTQLFLSMIMNIAQRIHFCPLTSCRWTCKTMYLLNGACHEGRTGLIYLTVMYATNLHNHVRSSVYSILLDPLFNIMDS